MMLFSRWDDHWTADIWLEKNKKANALAVGIEPRLCGWRSYTPEAHTQL